MSSAPTLYAYHPESGLPVGQIAADASPLEPGDWLWPAFSTDMPPPAAGEDESVRFANGGWIIESVPPPPEPPEPAPPSLYDYRLAIQSHVDATAQARSYDSGITCASYLGSTNPAWAAEAAAFVAWRDAVWGYAYTELAKVESGARPQPSVAEIVVELPAIVWPA